MKKLAEYFTESEQGSIRPQVGDTFDIVVNEELAIEADVLESTEDKLVLEYDERGIALLDSLGLIEGLDPESIEHIDEEELDEMHCGSKKKKYEDVELEENPIKKALGKLIKPHTTPTPTQDEKNDNPLKKFKDIFDRASTMPGVKKEEVMAEDSDEKFTDKEIKMAFGILNDPRFKGGNVTEITRRIEGIADGLSDHPSVRKALQRTNEDITNEAEYQGRKVKLGKPMRGDVAKYKVYVKDPKTGNVKKVNFGDKKMEIKRDNPKRRKNFRARHNCANPGPRTKARYWSCRMWSSKPVSKIV